TVPIGRAIFVRVRAANATGVSPPSNEVSFTAGSGVAPAAPTNLAVAGNAHGFITLMWIGPMSGDRPLTYQVQVGSVSGETLTTIPTSSSETVFTLPPGLPSSTSGGYFVRVLAVNAT